MDTTVTAEPPAAETVQEEPSLTDRAYEAWAVIAEYQASAAMQGLATRVRQLGVKDEDVSLEPDYFTTEAEPHLQIAAHVEAVTLCLTKGNQLAVVAWRCAEKGCHEVARLPVSGSQKAHKLASLGRALALGDKEALDRPNCREHTRKS